MKEHTVNKPKTRINHQITARELRIIGAEGEQLGIMTLSEALRAAEDAGYDLVEIAPGANPPVAKILDWGKYQYEQTKQLQKSRKNQRTIEVKQVRMGTKIADHDLEVKSAQAKRFLEKDHKVKVAVLFRGREITHPEIGYKLLERFYQGLAEIAVREQEPALAGRELSIILAKRDHAETQNP